MPCAASRFRIEIRIKLRSQKSGRLFCGNSCAAKYNNANVPRDGRRSQLEAYIEAKIQTAYPELELITNDRLLLGLEMDLYLPELGLAIEINGICHTKAIYGENTYAATQRNDLEKARRCEDLGIDLVVIDTSGQAAFSEASSAEYLTMVFNAIESHN